MFFKKFKLCVLARVTNEDTIISIVNMSIFICNSFLIKPTYCFAECRRSYGSWDLCCPYPRLLLDLAPIVKECKDLVLVNPKTKALVLVNLKNKALVK